MERVLQTQTALNVCMPETSQGIQTEENKQKKGNAVTARESPAPKPCQNKKLNTKNVK